MLALAGAAGLTLAWGQTCPVTPASDALRQITQCLAGGDCRGRTVRETENLGPGCEREIEVWSWHAARQAVAIRDRKMCFTRRKNPPTAGFVHGLLLPLPRTMWICRWVCERSVGGLMTSTTWLSGRRRRAASQASRHSPLKGEPAP